MTPEEKERLDKAFANLTKDESGFLKEHHIEPNKHGAYVFVSEDGSCRVALDLILSSYRNWLVGKKIVKEI